MAARPRRSAALPLPDREDQAAAGVQHDGVVAHAAANLLVHFAVDDHRPTGQLVGMLRVCHRDRQHEALARRVARTDNPDGTIDFDFRRAVRPRRGTGDTGRFGKLRLDSYELRYLR